MEKMLTRKVVFEVGTDSWEIFDEWNAEGVQF